MKDILNKVRLSANPAIVLAASVREAGQDMPELRDLGGLSYREELIEASKRTQKHQPKERRS